MMAAALLSRSFQSKSKREEKKNDGSLEQVGINGFEAWDLSLAGVLRGEALPEVLAAIMDSSMAAVPFRASLQYLSHCIVCCVRLLLSTPTRLRARLILAVWRFLEACARLNVYLKLSEGLFREPSETDVNKEHIFDELVKLCWSIKLRL